VFFDIDPDMGESDLGERVTYSFAAKQIRVVIKRTLSSRLRPAPWPHLVPETHNRDYGYRNCLGLTAFGRRYIAALRDHGMIIDLAHMSDRSIDDTLQVLGGSYPVIFSHAHFRRQAVQTRFELVPDFKPREYDISDSRLDRMFQSGGVVGPFVAEDRIEGNGAIPGIRNDCWMSSKMFAFSFHYAQSRLAAVGGRGGVGMATDFDFIPQTASRFGPRACIGLEPFFREVVEGAIHADWYQPLAQRDGIRYQVEHPASYARPGQDPLLPYRIGERTFDFNREGLAHFGLVPDMLQDLKNVGMPPEDLQALFSSAEAYIRMWERVAH
jgi:microsomal dipeptidase-like Zn-dependent dipeptidase